MSIQTHQVTCLFHPSETGTSYANGIDFEYLTTTEEFIFNQCSQCGLLFLNPQPTNDSLKIIYPKEYLPYQFDSLPLPIQKARTFVQKGKVNIIKKLVSQDAKIIDIGCGNGSLLKLLKKYGSPTWKLCANDFNDDSLFILSKEGFKTYSGSIENLNLSNEFDLVILNQVIEHMSDLHAILEAINHSLKPNGILLIETPSMEGLDHRLFKNRYWGGYHFPRHWVIFNEKLLKHLLEMHHFNVQETHYLTSPSFWLQSCHHALWDKGYKKLALIFSVKNPFALALFTMIDLIHIFSNKKTSNMRIIARKTSS